MLNSFMTVKVKVKVKVKVIVIVIDDGVVATPAELL